MGNENNRPFVNGGSFEITKTNAEFVNETVAQENSENQNVENYLKGKEIFGVDFSVETKSA